MSALQLRVNGIHSAWMAEFGLDNPHANELRQRDPYRMANVSYSLIQRDEAGGVLRHTLVDVGLGVMQSLLDFERSQGVHVVHEVLLSHSHFDHIGQLDWLANALGRNGREAQPRPLPVYCTGPCWEAGPARLFPWLLKERVRHAPVEPGEPIRLGEVTVTPMAVEHEATAPGAVGFVLEPHAPGTPGKIVLTCDFLTVPEPDDPRWQGADVCFIESNTWNPNPQTGHQSILEGLNLLRRWRPRRSYLIHYSGYEDAAHANAEVSRALTYAELEQQVHRHAGDLDIRIARHGMILGDDEPWPGDVNVRP